MCRILQVSIDSAPAKGSVLGTWQMIAAFQRLPAEGLDELCSQPVCSAPLTTAAIVFSKRTLCIFMNSVFFVHTIGDACFSVRQYFIEIASSAAWVLSKALASWLDVCE